MTTCKYHPTRLATSRCKRCGMPICNDCKMVSEIGVVCSQACLDAIKAFHERVKEVPHPRKRSFLSGRTVKGLLAVVILFAIAYAIVCFRAGEMLGPFDAVDQFISWGRSIVAYFF